MKLLFAADAIVYRLHPDVAPAPSPEPLYEKDPAVPPIAPSDFVYFR